MVKFSVITPCFNAWQFMDKYLDSLERQTYRDFEVIIVDDCSKDDTYDKLKAYVANSPLNIQLIQNQENHGPGYARNRGLAAANGEWITFVDSDDTVSPSLFEDAAAVTDKYDDADVPVNCIIYDYNVVKGEHSKSYAAMYGQQREGIRDLSLCLRTVRNNAWGKFYRTERVKKLSFPRMMRCEDVAFVCQALEACCMDDDRQIGSIYYRKKALYNYIQRKGSLTKDNGLAADDMIRAYDIIQDKLGRKYSKEIMEKSIPDLLYGSVLLMCKARNSKAEIIEYIDRYEGRHSEWWKSDIVNGVGKAKKVFFICIRHRWIILLKLLSAVHTRVSA